MKVAIQCVPSREFVVEKLLKNLPSDTKVYSDTEYRGSVWNMERIINDHPEGVLVVQDDLVMGEWFMEEVQKSLIEGEVMSFFLAITPRLKKLYDEGYSYAKMREIWSQCSYLPPSFIQQYVKWSAGQPPIAKRGDKEAVAMGHRKFSADDTCLRMCLKANNRWAYLTLPNLVNHQCEIPSELGHQSTTKGIPRVSFLYGKKFLRTWNKEAIVKYD